MPFVFSLLFCRAQKSYDPDESKKLKTLSLPEPVLYEKKYYFDKTVKVTKSRSLPNPTPTIKIKEKKYFPQWHALQKKIRNFFWNWSDLGKYPDFGNEIDKLE